MTTLMPYAQKRILIFLFLFILLLDYTYGQRVVSGTSATKYVSITKDGAMPVRSDAIPVKEGPKLPFLEIVPNSMVFKDENNHNNKIDANESSIIHFDLKNTGTGIGNNLVVNISESNILSGLVYPKEVPLGNLDPRKTLSVDIPVTGLMNLPTFTANFSIRVSEARGFGTDPLEIEIPTQEFQEPFLKVVDYKVSSQQAGTLIKKKPFDLDVLVQNTGRGIAKNISANLVVPQNVFCLSGNENFQKTTLAPGEQVMISYSLVANNDYNLKTLPFTVKLKEKYDKYMEDKLITLTMNQLVSENKLIVKGTDEQHTDIKIGSLSSSVDKNIPLNIIKNPNRYALVIGNENYSSNLNAEINVEFAYNDATMFRDYAISTLGVNEQNMIYLADATSGTMRREIERVSELVKRTGSKAELIFYYAGHGFPDETTQVPFLIPVDVDATNLQSAIKLSEVYTRFSETGAKSITVFLDACFSGGGRNQGLVAARSVKIKPRFEYAKGNMVVFAATSGLQVALPYKEQKHGMFTYFLLKNMQDTNGKFTYGQLADYLKQNVGIESLRTNSKPQDPEVQASPAVENSWRNWSFQ